MILLEKTLSRQAFSVRYQVQKFEENIRLDLFVAQSFPSWSREKIKKKIKNHEILIEGRPSRPSTKLQTQEIISIQTPYTPPQTEIWKGKEIPLPTQLPVIFEDHQLLVVNKPPFMAVHPTGRHLFHVATLYLQEQFQQNLHSVHRLDRETSGLLLLAKTPQKAAHLTRLFTQGHIKKTYFFISKLQTPHPLPPNLTCKLPIEGRQAQTHFAIQEVSDTYAWGKAFPQTGRRHQIRLHAQSLGLPLLGDKRYLQDKETFLRFKKGQASAQDCQTMELPRHALHAWSLDVEGQKFKAPIPQDLMDFAQRVFTKF